jgi:phosphate transport system permease protein
MTPGTIAIIVLILAAIGYVLGRRRALQAAKREGVKLHSLPGYYGESVALFTAVPALFLMAAWLFVQPIVIESSISAKIPDSVVPEGGAKSLVMVDVRRISDGLGSDSSRKAMCLRAIWWTCGPI